MNAGVGFGCRVRFWDCGGGGGDVTGPYFGLPRGGGCQYGRYFELLRGIDCQYGRYFELLRGGV